MVELNFLTNWLLGGGVLLLLLLIVVVIVVVGEFSKKKVAVLKTKTTTIQLPLSEFIRPESFADDLKEYIFKLKERYERAKEEFERAKINYKRFAYFEDYLVVAEYIQREVIFTPRGLHLAICSGGEDILLNEQGKPLQTKSGRVKRITRDVVTRFCQKLVALKVLEVKSFPTRFKSRRGMLHYIKGTPQEEVDGYLDWYKEQNEGGKLQTREEKYQEIRLNTINAQMAQNEGNTVARKLKQEKAQQATLKRKGEERGEERKERQQPIENWVKKQLEKKEPRKEEQQQESTIDQEGEKKRRKEYLRTVPTKELWILFENEERFRSLPEDYQQEIIEEIKERQKGAGG